MQQTIELKALQWDREISTLRIWVFRIIAVLVTINALSTGYESIAGALGAITALVVILGAILHVLSSERSGAESASTTEQPTTAN